MSIRLSSNDKDLTEIGLQCRILLVRVIIIDLMASHPFPQPLVFNFFFRLIKASSVDQLALQAKAHGLFLTLSKGSALVLLHLLDFELLILYLASYLGLVSLARAS